MKGRKLVFAVALVALVVVAVVAVAWAAPVGVGGDRQRPSPPVALKCQSGTACGGAPVAAQYPSHLMRLGYECQSGFACGGMLPNASVPKRSAVAVWPLPGTNAMCQSGTACGG